jgi:pyruvate dehydrogenase E2 component (dihydrolipoamide acetyltransferase)
MPAGNTFKLPDVGEGLTEAEIVTWKVKVGDTVKVNDVVVEIETAKSLVELPSPYAGTVAELLVGEGETVNVGTPLITVASGEELSAAAPTGGRTSAEDVVPTPKDGEAVEPGLIGGPAPGGRTSVLVGYGPRTTEAKRRPRRAATPQATSSAAAQVGVQNAFSTQPMQTPQVSTAEAEPAAPAQTVDVPVARLGAQAKVLAKPPVRKFAKDLGVDLDDVTPTGPNGTITRSDVEGLAGRKPLLEGSRSAEPGPDWSMGWGLPDGTLYGAAESRIPIKGVRKMTAQAMVASAFTAPHVTEWVTVDATRTMKLVKRLRGSRDFRDLKVSPLLVVARAVCLAVQRTPELNATWDESAQEIVVKHYVNLGIAAATPRGLVVPNVKDAHRMSGPQLARELAQLTQTARDGKAQPADLSGGTFTITNVGVFGIDSGTPILNPGEAGILAMGAIRRQPWVVGNRVKPRWVTTLAVSFDHRIVDGEQGSRFLADVAAIVADPGASVAL